MYKVRRLRKLFGTSSSSIQYGGKSRGLFKPRGTEVDTEFPSFINKDSLPLKWSNVDYYKINADDVSRKFKDHYKFLGNKASRSQLARNLVKRTTSLLDDLRGRSDGEQYVSHDNPHTPIDDNTHMLAGLSDNNTLVYSKDVTGEFKLVYEAERPHKESGMNVSDVTVDDVDDHMYKGQHYGGGNGTSSYDNPNRFK